MPSLVARRLSPAALVLLFVCAAPRLASAAPQINDISLRGLQIGGTTTITLQGSQLLPEPQLVLPIPIASQTVREGATAERIELEVTLAADVPPGVYPLRLSSAHGISNSLLIGVDRLPQQPLASEVSQLPVALHGQLTGGQIVQVQVAGTKGMRLVADLESRRLGANLRPVLRILQPDGSQLTWSGARKEIAGDARCEVELPVDGTYTVQLHDVLYRGAAPGFYRLKLGQLQYADLAFPVAVQQGQSVELQYASTNLAADMKASFAAPSDQPTGLVPAAVPDVPAWTGARPPVVVSRHTEVIESRAAADSPQELPGVPCGVSGRVLQRGEEDRYILAVRPGTQLRFDVLAHRMGASMDAVLLIRNEQGAQLARGDDRPNSTDPLLDYQVPENVERLVVCVSELTSQAGSDCVYHLSVQEASAEGFRLQLDESQITIPASGTQVVRVQLARSGYAGPVQLRLHGVDAAVTLSGAEVPAGDTIALLGITAAAEANGLRGIGALVGQASDSSQMQWAERAGSGATQQHAWLRRDLGIAVAPQAPLRLEWAESGVPEQFVPGTTQPLRVRLTSIEGTTGTVRLRLLTTQPTPQRTIQENNQDKVVDDVERTLRLEAPIMLSAGSQEASVPLVIPPDLEQKAWGVVLVAELLASDNQTVLATAATPTVYRSAIAPLTVSLSSASQIEAKAGLGETGQLTGTVQRAPGFEHPVTITLASLPEGFNAPQVVVPPDQTDFTLPVSFAYEAAKGPLSGVKLLATAAPYDSRTDVVARSNEVPVEITVVPGEKPAE